jgi:hypothetical protein
MLFRFSISHVSGLYSCYDRNLDSLADAKAWVQLLLQSWGYIQSVTLHKHLTDDSCDQIQFIGTFILDGTKVINRDTKEAI